MKQKSNMKGITLIALVITIVVLLILAGVSIAMITGENGILTQAQKSKEATENGDSEERINLVVNEWEIEKYRADAKDLETFLNSKVTNGEINSVTQNADGTFTVEVNGYKSGIDANGHLSCQTHSNNTFIIGKLYATGLGESFSATANTTYNADNGLREPAIVKDYDNDTENYNKVGLTLDGLKSEYKLMAESVKKYGGFYVGRYEASLTLATPTSAGTIGTMQSKSGVKPTASTNSYTRMWYGLYEKAKGYTVSEDSVQSSMIWESQYDAMLNWVKSSGSSDISKITTQGIGNNTSRAVATTGNSTYSNDSINKIRDLGGNLWEWTLEANNAYNRVGRGGYYTYSKSPSYRGSYLPDGTYASYGTRLTLYIK